MSAMHDALADDTAAVMSPVTRPPLSAVPLPSPPAPPRGMSRRQARALKRASRTSRRAESTWTGGHKRIAMLLAIAALGIAGVAFWALFGSTTAVMNPWMGPRSWMVPVAGEIAFMYFFGSGILHALRRAPSGAIRPLVTWLIVAGSVVIQAEASRHHVHVHGPAPRGVLVSLVGHEVIVVAFYGVLLSAKSTVMILLGGKVRADRITFAEWVAHPVQAGRLWRWRATWGEPSADAARERYMRLLFAETIAQADPRVGRKEGWREKLPAILAYQLSTGLFPGSVASAGGDWQETVRCHVESQLALLPAATPAATDGDRHDAIRDATPLAIEGATVAATEDATGTPALPPSSTPPVRQTARQRDASERAKANARAKRILTRDPATPLADVVAKSGVSERTASRIKSQLARAAEPTP